MILQAKSVLSGSKKSTFNCKKTLIILGFFSIGVFLASCKKESQYYVKYEIESRNIYYGGKLNVELKDESNNSVTYTVDQREVWEIVIGPVEEGFNAHMKVKASGGNSHVQLYPCIYICINNEPFTLEKSDKNDDYRDEVELSYRIE